jgi:hypothetical protein
MPFTGGYAYSLAPNALRHVQGSKSPASFHPPGSALPLRTTRERAAGSLRCVGTSASGDNPEAEKIVFSQPPPAFDPRVMLPPTGLKPTKSRYESFYREKSGEEGEAIDVSSHQEGAGDEEPPTNPFFVGYDMKDLGFIWDVHLNTVGERPSGGEEKSESSSTEPSSLGGGLHDLILDICNEVDAEKKNGSDK